MAAEGVACADADARPGREATGVYAGSKPWPRPRTDVARSRAMSSEISQTQNSILRISDEKTLQLIELYEQEECLWNTFSQDYKSRDKRQKATERIARKLNIKHFEARHVVIKFKNLRNSYCQELKKIGNSVNMGLSEDEIYKPRVFWFSKMDSFLRPHLQPVRNSLPNLQVPEIEHREIRVKSEDGVDSDSNHVSEDSRHSYPVVDVDESIHSDDCEPPPKKRHSFSCPSRHREDLTQTVRELEMKIQALTEEKKEDYYDSFGKYIASLLRSMPKERAMLLQPQVISLIVSGSGLGEGSVSQSDGNDI